MKGSIGYLLLSFVGVSVLGAAKAEASCGKFLIVKGDVTLESATTKKSDKAKINAEVCSGDTITAAADSRAKVVMLDGNELNISPDSKLKIENYDVKPEEGKKKVLLNVIFGKVRSTVNEKYGDKDKNGEENTFQVKTKSAVAGVRGTDFLTSVNPKTFAAEVVTFAGKVDVGQAGPGGKIMNPVSVTAGQSTTASPGQPPAPARPVPASQLQQMNSETKADTGGAAKTDAPPAKGSNQQAKSGDGKSGDGKSSDGAKGDGGGKSGDSAKADGAKSDGGGKSGDSAKADGAKSDGGGKSGDSAKADGPGAKSSGDSGSGNSAAKGGAPAPAAAGPAGGGEPSGGGNNQSGGSSSQASGGGTTSGGSTGSSSQSGSTGGGPAPAMAGGSASDSGRGPASAPAGGGGMAMPAVCMTCGAGPSGPSPGFIPDMPPAAASGPVFLPPTAFLPPVIQTGCAAAACSPNQGPSHVNIIITTGK